LETLDPVQEGHNFSVSFPWRLGTVRSTKASVAPFLPGLEKPKFLEQVFRF